MEGLTEREKEDLEYAFSLYKDGDGLLDARNFQKFLASIKIYARIGEIEDVMKAIDLSQDGRVNQEEAFNFIAAKKIAGFKEDELRDAFRKFETSGDAKLSREELMNLLTKYGSEPFSEEEAKAIADEMLNAYDVDGDGHLRYDEFINAIFGTL